MVPSRQPPLPGISARANGSRGSVTNVRPHFRDTTNCGQLRLTAVTVGRRRNSTVAAPVRTGEDSRVDPPKSTGAEWAAWTRSEVLLLGEQGVFDRLRAEVAARCFSGGRGARPRRRSTR